MKQVHLWCSTVAPVLALTVAASPAHAQTKPLPPSTPTKAEAPDNTASSGDIVITARKRDEKLRDVPISVQAFNRDQIKTGGIQDLQTLKDRAGFQFPPQVSNGPAGRFTGVLIFRGLQANSFGQARDNSGSLFVDGIYVSGGVQSVNTSDVDRIEVLKGPQNAYFGRGTFGGAVNFITRNPSATFGGEVNVRGTLRGTVDADASIEGSIIPGLLTARLTGNIHNKVAQYHANDGGDLGAEKSQGVSATLYLTPSPNSFLRLRGKFQRDDDSAPSYAFIPSSVYGSTCTGTYPGFNQLTGLGPVTLAKKYFCDGAPTLDDVGTSIITQNTALPAAYKAAIALSQRGGGTLNVPYFTDVPKLDHFGLRRNTVFLSAQGGYTFDGGAALAFNAGYNQQDSIDINDVDKTDVLLGFLDTLAFRTKDLTLDGRFTSDPSKRIRLLVGASYFHGKTQFADLQNSLFSPTPSRGSNFTNERDTTPSIYGSVDFDIVRNLTLTGEARYQWDTISSRNILGATVGKRTFKSFLPRVILKFKPNTDTMVYASYSRGVQPAGLNTGYANLSGLTFSSQAIAYVQGIYPGISIFSLLPKLTAYEAGIKQRLFNGAVDYTLAVYQNDWDHATTTSTLFNSSTCLAALESNTANCPLAAGGVSLLTPNDARIRGIEFAATGHVSPAFSVDLTLDYKNAKWRRYANSGFNAFTGLTAPGSVYRGDGNYLARVPALTGTLSATYRGHFSGSDWRWYARGDVLYTGKAWDSEINIFKTDDYARVNVNLGIQKPNLTLELFATNLFNNKSWDAVANTVELSGTFTSRALAVIPAQKREFGVRTQFKF